VKTSARGIELIASFEGFFPSRQPYNDPTGFCTAGYGRLLHRSRCTDADVRKWRGLTKTRAKVMLAEDVEKYAAHVNRLIHVPLNQNQYDALVSFVFNLGPGAVGSGSTLARKLNAGDYSGAQREFDRWVKGRVNGRLVVIPGLVRRRNAEQALFGSGAPPKPKPRDPLTSAERYAVKRLEHWRDVARGTGWERDGKPTEAKIAAETWKRHIPAHYVKAIEVAVARDIKAGVDRSDALKRHRRGERKRILLGAVTPPPRERDAGEPDAGDYPKGLPRAYRKHWRKPWTEAAARHGGFRKWLDAHGMLSPHFSKREAGSKDGVSIDAGGVNKAARDHAFNMEKLRHLLGDVPIGPISWYRSPAHNRRVGGASRSQHMGGRATDLSRAFVDRIGPKRFFAAADVVFRRGGVGRYPGGSAHVDSRGYRARWSSF
jgi:lysozyme